MKSYRVFNRIYLHLITVILAISVAACGAPSGGSGDSSSTDSSSTVLSADAPKTISWTPPTTYTDGSPLTGISKYRLYYGPTGDTLQLALEIDNMGSSYTLTQADTDSIANLMVANSTHFFALTVVDSQGLESGFSNFVQL